ncbi:helix-turn-helix domain-containing protein [Epilithonimonas zeae]|uniref:helix-turn-helix domain-containing protein n=1 Tax=Epilithonimonas zeae TaxID=1416779 RepID=UPI00200C8528|nr:helix-turn-helix domain-containing protein [Epilithonimonas zeae]
MNIFQFILNLMGFDVESFSSQLFYLAGILIAFFACFLLLGKPQKRLADYLLSAWFLLIGIHLICFLFIFSNSYIRFPYLLGLEIPLPLVHGPMLYLYISCLTGNYPKRKMWFLHLAPVLITYFFLIDFFLMSSHDKIEIYRHNGGSYKVLRTIISVIIALSGIFYVILSTLTIKKYQRQISNIFSNTEKINLNWGYYLIIGISTIWVAVIIKSEILIFSLVVLFVVLAAYFGISKVGILNPAVLDKKNDENLNTDEDVEYPKYQKNFAGDETIQRVYKKLNSMMNDQKLYKDPEINLNHIAKLLDVHPNVLSQTINSVENKNFYDYINRYRIEEFKRIVVLPENQKFTILTLAFECGFNSKTSFNRNFKKYTGCSPREFLKDQKLIS